MAYIGSYKGIPINAGTDAEVAAQVAAINKLQAAPSASPAPTAPANQVPAYNPVDARAVKPTQTPASAPASVPAPTGGGTTTSSPPQNAKGFNLAPGATAVPSPDGSGYRIQNPNGDTSSSSFSAEEIQALGLAAPTPSGISTTRDLIQKELSGISKDVPDDGVQTRDTFNIEDYLAGLPKPQAPNLAETYTKLNTEYGVDQLENDLNAANENLLSFQNDLVSQANAMKGEPVSTAYINRQLVKLDADSRDALNDLNLRRQSIIDRLDTRSKTVSLMMQFTQQDYANARAEYDSSYNRAYQMMTFFAAEQERYDQQQNQIRDDARASLQVIRESMGNGSYRWEDLNAEQQAYVNALDVKAYGISGVTQYIKPTEKELDTFTDVSGNRISTFYTPGTNEFRQVVIGQAEIPEGGGGGGVGADGTVDPAVQSWVDMISRGAATVAGVPDTWPGTKNSGFKTAVIQVMDAQGVVELSDTQRNTLQSLNAVEGILDSLQQSYNKLKNLFAGNFIERGTKGLILQASATLQSDPEATSFQKFKEAILATLARASGERGVLTDQDVDRARQNLPNLTDTQDVVELKLNRMRSLFTELKQKSISTFTSSASALSGGANNDPLGLR